MYRALIILVSKIQESYQIYKKQETLHFHYRTISWKMMYRALIILVLGLLSQQTLSKVIPGKGPSLVRVTRSQDAADDRVMVSRFNSISIIRSS